MLFLADFLGMNIIGSFLSLHACFLHGTLVRMWVGEQLLKKDTLAGGFFHKYHSSQAQRRSIKVRHVVIRSDMRLGGHFHRTSSLLHYSTIRPPSRCTTLTLQHSPTHHSATSLIASRNHNVTQSQIRADHIYLRPVTQTGQSDS